MKQVHPPLYSKDRKGGIRVWQVAAVGDCVVVESGKLGCKLAQHTDRAKGTNKGRANERTGEMQAEFEAAAAWAKKKDEGYFETINDAETKTVYLPMLAKPLMKDQTKNGVKTKVMREVAYPLDVQFKLNGVRCLAKVLPLGIEFTSREGEHWGTLGHIASDLRDIGAIGDIYDGEIYRHGAPLQDINSWIKNPEKQTERLTLGFCIYDMPCVAGTDPGCWEDRKRALRERQGRTRRLMVGGVGSDSPHAPLCMNLSFVESYTAMDYSDVQRMGAQAIGMGFEGLILRQRSKGYEWNQRCESLLKWKQFKDAEFEVVGGSCREVFYEKPLSDGTASYMILDKFVCQNNINDQRFEVVPVGSNEQKREYWNNLQSHIGQFLTVRFLERSKDGIPQGNPVGMAFRLPGDLPSQKQDEDVGW